MPEKPFVRYKNPEVKVKRQVLLFFIIGLFVSLVMPAAAETLRDNPSLFSFAEIVQKLPKLWDANPIEVTEMMRKYQDFECFRSYDIIACTSVNNRYSAEIHANYQFSSEDDYAEFTHATFTMMIDSSEDVQNVIESFWLPEMSILNIWGAEFPDNQITLYFGSEETMEKYSVFLDPEGKPWLLTVDLGHIRG